MRSRVALVLCLLVTIFAVTSTSAFAAVIAEYDLQENPITNGTTAVDSSGYAPETDLTYYSTDTVPTLYSTSGGYYGGSDLAAHFNYGSTSYYQDMVYGPSTSSKMLYYQQTGTIEVAFKIDAGAPVMPPQDPNGPGRVSTSSTRKPVELRRAVPDSRNPRQRTIGHELVVVRGLKLGRHQFCPA